MVIGLQVLILMEWAEVDELVTLDCESPGQGQEKQGGSAGPPGELPVDPP